MANPFPLYLLGFFFILERLIAPKTIATTPSGIPAINKPTTPAAKPAIPNPSTSLSSIFTAFVELLLFYSWIILCEYFMTSLLNIIAETFDFAIEIIGPLKLLHFLYFISVCPISSTLPIRFDPDFNIIVSHLSCWYVLSVVLTGVIVVVTLDGISLLSVEASNISENSALF